MGNVYVNTVELIEAVSNPNGAYVKSRGLDEPESNRPCYKCYCVPNYVNILQSCDGKQSPQHKPRKLIRNPNIRRSLSSEASKELSLPAPIIVEESYCLNSDTASLDLCSAMLEVPEAHSPDNSSYSTIDINNSNSNDSHNFEDDYKTKIQQDIIKRNVFHHTRDYTKGGNDGTALAKLVMATSPISDQDRDNFMEDDHYNYAFVRSLGLHDRKKKRKSRKKKKKVKKVHSVYY